MSKRIPRRGWLLLAVLIPVAACAKPMGSPPNGGSLAGRVWDVAAGGFLDEETFLERLAEYHYVLLGEKHDNAEHHRIQATIIARLAMEGRRPALAFEMLSSDFDRVLADSITRSGITPSDIREAVYWDESGWPDWSLYEPIFVTALALRLPMVGAGLPSNDLDALRSEGVAGLRPALRERLGLDEAPPTAQVSALAEDIRLSHCNQVPEQMLPRMVETQRTRDAHLARALVEAASISGSDGAVLIAGFGHVRSDWAAPFALRQLDPKSSAASVAIIEVPVDPGDPTSYVEERFGESIPFDYLWYTERVDDLDPCEKFKERLEQMRAKGDAKPGESREPSESE